MTRNSSGTRVSDTAIEPEASQFNLLPSASSPTLHRDFAVSTSNGSSLQRRKCSSPGGTPTRYLELCINVGGKRALGEVPLAHIQTDGELFKAVYEKYKEVRGSRIRDLYLVEPTAVHFVKASSPILKVPCTLLICLHSSILRTDTGYMLMRPKEPIVGHRKTK
jgi:hypothetical protein